MRCLEWSKSWKQNRTVVIRGGGEGKSGNLLMSIESQFYKIEVLIRDQKLHRWQQQMLEHKGAQTGCTSDSLMNLLETLVDHSPNPFLHVLKG